MPRLGNRNQIAFRTEQVLELIAVVLVVFVRLVVFVAPLAVVVQLVVFAAPQLCIVALLVLARVLTVRSSPLPLLLHFSPATAAATFLFAQTLLAR